MDIRESIWDSANISLQRSVCITYGETFLPRGIQYFTNTIVFHHVVQDTVHSD